MNVVYVTGNKDKARYFSRMIGIDIPHEKVKVEELQSLDIREVVTHKVKEAHRILQKPVLVEDTQLIFKALGNLPGPFIKWFLEEIGHEGLCRLLTPFKDRSATAGAAIAYYDGSQLEIFENRLNGRIATQPSGTTGFGWNHIFIPDGEQRTLGEMSEAEFKVWYQQVKPFEAVVQFLGTLDTGQA